MMGSIDITIASVYFIDFIVYFNAFFVYFTVSLSAEKAAFK